LRQKGKKKVSVFCVSARRGHWLISLTALFSIPSFFARNHFLGKNILFNN
jgi:hypothetical protein